MTLSTLAKISAAYLGLAVTFATAATVFEVGRDLAGEYDIKGVFLSASNGASG